MSILIGSKKTSPVAKVKAGRAMALQIKGKGVAKMDVASARASIMATVERVDATIQAAAGWLGGDLNIVVLPNLVSKTFESKSQKGTKKRAK